METQLKRSGMLLLLIFAFAFARAGFVPHINSSPSCHGNDGKIIFSNYFSGGYTPPFTVSVYNAAVGYYYSDSSIFAAADTVSGLAPGVYHFQIYNNSNGSGYASDTITVGSVVAISPTIVNSICPANNGSISVSVSGGLGSYSYLWSTGATSSSISGLPQGQYALTVSDAGGCSSGLDTFIYASSSIVVSIASAGPVCNPVLRASATGTSGAVTYQWDNGNTGDTLTNLVSYNYYEVTATDANGCTGYNYIQIGQLGLNIDTITHVVNANCSNTGGSITVRMENGTSPFSYVWSNGGPNDSIDNNLSSGLYYVTVTDANGCTSSSPAYVGQVNGLTLDSSHYVNPNCLGGLGSVTEHSLSGTAPFTYLWSNGSTDSTITGLSAGTYVVTVTDANGCVGHNYFYLYPAVPYFPIYTITNPSCNQANGAIDIGPIYYGTGPYSYHWSNGATTDTAANLAAGYYTVTVTDAGTGCSASNYDSLYSAAPIYVYFDNLTNPSCGSSNGTLGAMAYYGSGAYSYLWSNGSTSQDLTGLAADTYTVTATDLSGGCTASSSYTLYGISNFQLSVNVTPTSCDTTLHTGSATVVINGSGVAPYTFKWVEWEVNDSGYYVQDSISNQQTVSNLSYNSFLTVYVTDASGCISYNSYDSVQIPFDPSCYDHIIGYLFTDSNANCILDSGEHGVYGGYVYATGSNGQYYWATPDSTGFYDIQVLPGIYTVSFSINSFGSCIGSSCINTYLDTFTIHGQVSSGNNFGISTTGADFDLGVHPGCTSSTPGSQKEYWIYYWNQGLIAANNAVVSFTYDPSLTLVSSNPSYSSINTTTHVITWNVGSVPANYIYYNWTQITMEFDVPSTVTLGQVLLAQAEIDPLSGDCDPSNNLVNFSDVVSASHDPNEKQVSPVGNLSESDTVLTYTIRFQNTGNAPANTVVISDTLSHNVNAGTVTPGASSAPYKFALSGNGVLTFTFQGINLPDSSHGDSSKGFVNYTVHTKGNLPLGAQIDNTAYIYFDANAPVITNTTVNTRSNYPNGISTIANSDMNAQVIPNPANDIATIRFSGSTGNIQLQITDALGNMISSSSVIGKAYILDAESLASGIYFYTAKDALGHSASGKISVVH